MLPVALDRHETVLVDLWLIFRARWTVEQLGCGVPLAAVFLTIIDHVLPVATSPRGLLDLHLLSLQLIRPGFVLVENGFLSRGGRTYLPGLQRPPPTTLSFHDVGHPGED